MQETLRQIGELLLNSIPTILCLLVLWTAYTFMVHNPLRQVLAKRRALTEGAVEQARKEIASAEARTAEYEQKLREARAQIFKTQESYSKRVMDERAKALAEARTTEYEQKLREARAQIFKTQESYSKRVMDERAKALAEARKQADQMIKSARHTVQQEVEAAKAGLDKQADTLADQVIQTVLRPAAGVGSR